MIIEDIETLQEELTELKERLETLNNGDNDNELIDLLNDSYPAYKIGNLEFYAGDVLKEMDNIAFREKLNNYNDSEITDINDKIKEIEDKIKELQEGEQ